MLVLFSICCAVGFSASASALTMEKDMKASEITIEDGMTIDGAGKFSITGGLSVSNGEDITIKNVTLDGESTQDILLSLKDAGNVVIENVTFTHFVKTGIYAEKLTSLNVTSSTFDGIDTDKLKDQSYPGNPEEELIKRSPACIDLNLGNGGKEVNVNTITLSNNTFKNLKIAREYLATSTGGAVKIKVKDMSAFTKLGSVTIQNNTFEDNARDLVIGTDSPSSSTTSAQTGDLEILLVDNGAIVVKNNSGDGATETLDGNYKLNYADDKKLELDDNLFYVVNDDNFEAFENDASLVMGDADIKGISVSVSGVSFAIAKEDIDDEFLEDAMNFAPVVSEEATIDALKPYQGEDVFFVDMTGSSLFVNGISINTTLGEGAPGKLYVYYYDEENGLQLASSPEVVNGDVTLNFAKDGNYVVSAKDLLSTSMPSEEVTEEEVPEVPQTFDALGIYAGVGFVSIAGIAGVVIYLKKRNA